MPQTNPKTIPLSNLSKSLKKLYTFLAAAANFINDFEVVTVSATASSTDNTVYRTKVIGGGAARVLNVGNGAGAVVGQRKLVTLDTFTAGDTVVLDHANMLNASGTAPAGCVLDALNEFVLLEWTGAKWKAIYSATGVVT